MSAAVGHTICSLLQHRTLCMFSCLSNMELQTCCGPCWLACQQQYIAIDHCDVPQTFSVPVHQCCLCASALLRLTTPPQSLHASAIHGTGDDDGMQAQFAELKMMPHAGCCVKIVVPMVRSSTLSAQPSKCPNANAYVLPQQRHEVIQCSGLSLPADEA